MKENCVPRISSVLSGVLDLFSVMDGGAQSAEEIPIDVETKQVFCDSFRFAPLCLALARVSA